MLQLDRNPLAFVLAQVQFSAILQMEDYIPAIQEKLRNNGLPRFARAEQQEIQVAPSVRVNTATRWIFADRPNRYAFVLSNDFAVLECSEYTSFDDFTDRLLKTLSILAESLDIGFVTRLGLRYVNLVESEEGHSPSDLLRPGLRGLDPDAIDVHKMLHLFQSVALTPHGRLIVRLLQNEGDSILPPDLATTTLELRKSTDDSGIVTLLDFDHFTTEERDFDPDEIIRVFWELHEYTDLAFRAAVTDVALKAWGGT